MTQLPSVRAEFLTRIDTGSTLADLPGYEAALEMSERAKRAGDFFHSNRDSPGLLLTEQGRFRTVLSRRYYHEIVGQYCGMDLYHPRPLRFMMERMEALGGALCLGGETPIELAVRHGLERPRALVYEPLVVDLSSDPASGQASGPATGKVRLVDFEDLLAADARVTLLRGEQMKQILATVREGLLLVDRDLRIGLEYAGSVEAILETRGLAGRSLPEVLSACLDAERAQLATEYLDLLFNPRVIESLIAKINPLLRVTGYFSGGRRKVLAFRFVRGVVGHRIRHVLVRIEDLTREDELARELEGHRRRGEQQMELAVAAMQTDPEALVGLLDRLNPQVFQVEAVLQRPPGWATTGALGPLLRELHGAKGEAGILGFAPLVREIHLLESALAAYQEGAGEETARGLRERVSTVQSVLSATRSVLEQLARFGRALDREPAEHWPASLQTALERWVAKLAVELNKPARFLWRLEGVELPESHVTLLRETLAQLVRNSLVHGVEPAEVRRERGKPPVATLQLAARRRPDAESVDLIFQDDGGGLDLPALRAKAERLGLDAACDEDLRRLIFRPGFSTAAAVDLHAGRGVGLDLVRERIEATGGRIEVHSEAGRYCAFRIRLPWNIAETPQ